jgi:hypothetical protein
VVMKALGKAEELDPWLAILSAVRDGNGVASAGSGKVLARQ